jgi:hypothetical protein
MSSELFLVYYGLRFDVNLEEIQQLEDDLHPSVVSANKVGLDTTWGNYDPYGGETYYLFIGSEIAIIGGEGIDDKAIDEESLIEIMRFTKDRLVLAGFNSTPKLLLQWKPDH